MKNLKLLSTEKMAKNSRQSSFSPAEEREERRACSTQAADPVRKQKRRKVPHKREREREREKKGGLQRQRILSPARASVDFVSDIEAAHVVGDVRVEVQKGAARAGDDFGHPPNVIVVLVHEPGEDAEQGRLDAVPVEDVQVVPAAFRRELLDVHAYRRVGAALDQPRALYVRRVVADPVVDAARGLR